MNFDLRAPLYVQSVNLDGREIKGRYFHLAATAPAKLEVEVSGGWGQVNAHILADSSLPNGRAFRERDVQQIGLP